MAQKRKQKRRRSKKWLYWLLMVLLFVGAVVICYFVWDVYFRVKDDVVKNSNDSGKNELVTEEKKEEDEKTKEEADKNDEQVIPEVVEKEKTIQYEGGDPNASESLTGAITYAGVSGSEIMIRTNIDQYLTAGKCELVLERGGAVIYRTEADIITSVATSVCDGFNVPVSELGGGEINITIKITADERRGSLYGKVNI